MNYRLQAKRDYQQKRRQFWIILIVCLLATVGYLRSRLWVIDLSYEYGELSRELRELRRDNAALRVEAARLKAPARIERVAREKFDLRRRTPETPIITIDLQGGERRQ